MPNFVGHCKIALILSQMTAGRTQVVLRLRGRVGELALSRVRFRCRCIAVVDRFRLFKNFQVRCSMYGELDSCEHAIEVASETTRHSTAQHSALRHSIAHTTTTLAVTWLTT